MIMKKLLYAAALLAVAAGCSKSELKPAAEETQSIAVSIKLPETATKSSYDGERHIAYEYGDAFYGAIAKPDTPTKAVKVATGSAPAASVYYSNFRVRNYEAGQTPEFYGWFYNFVEADYSDEYKFYGLYPTSAVSTTYCKEDLTKWTVNLPTTQSSSQTSWSGKADAMVLEPTTVSSTYQSYNSTYGEYTVRDTSTVKFAHLFGFCHLTFNVPSAYADLVVKSIRIDAVGENKAIVGYFDLDITKRIDEIELKSTTPYSYITLNGDKETTVSKYNAWFVAAPGTYDVKITVATSKADLIFEREGLVITRSKITAPVVNLKEADTIDSHDVKLADGETWSQEEFSYYKALGSSYTERDWGPTGKTMSFSLSYPGANNSNYGAYWSAGSGYVQGLASNNISGGLIDLHSAAAFEGAKLIKVGFGIYTFGETCRLSVKLVNDADTVSLGSVAVKGTGDTEDHDTYYFANPTNAKGELHIIVDSLSNTLQRPYVSVLTLNPAPGIVLSESSLKFDADADTTGVITCKVDAADGDPTVTVSEDAQSWLTASYADGKITYHVAKNTDKKRTGTITVSATGLSTTSKTIAVTQKSAFEIEYKLSVTGADIYKLVEAKIAELKAAGTEIYNYDSYALTGTFQAKSLKDETKTVDVELKFDGVALLMSTDSSAYIKGSIYATSEVGFVEEMTMHCDKYFGTSGWSYVQGAVSYNGSTWTALSPKYTKDSETGIYTNTVTNTSENFTWFKYIAFSYNAVLVYDFSVTFVGE